MRAAKIAGCLLFGAVIAAALVPTLGMLSVQSEALRGGAVLDLNNDVIAVNSSASPVPRHVAAASLCVAAFLVIVLWPGRFSMWARVSMRLGFAIVATLLIVWGFRLDAEAGPGGGADLRFALEGWEGWVQFGGRSPAVHFLLALVLISGRTAWLPSAARSRRFEERDRDDSAAVA